MLDVRISMCINTLQCPSLSNVFSRRVPHTYARGNGRAALLVAFCTAVARDTSHAVFTGTLSCGLVTGFASSTHGMAITCCEETEEEREAKWVVARTCGRDTNMYYLQRVQVGTQQQWQQRWRQQVVVVVVVGERWRRAQRQSDTYSVASVLSWLKGQHIL